MERAGRPLTLLGMSARNLYRQPLRTVLTALGVSVGVTAIVALGTITHGLVATTDDAIRFGGADLMVFQAGVAADIFSILDEESTHAALMADPDVARAAPTLWHIMPAPKMRFGFIIGIHPDEMRRHGEYLVEGRYPEEGDEILIGTIAARLLDRHVGDELRLARHRLRIVGMFQTGIVYFDGAINMTISRLQEIVGRKGKVSNFQVTLRPGADTAVVVKRIERANPGLVAIADADQYHKVDEGLEIANATVNAVSFMAIVIGAVIVANTMWMTVHERTREIGVLRALGWARRKIVAMIIIEASGVGLVACVLGCLFGVGLAEASTRLSVAAQFIDPVFGWQPFAMALSVAMSLSVLGGALPAWRAARISPIVALRCE